MTVVPVHPKIYHIVHVDRLSSIVADGRLWCDAEVIRRGSAGTTIGFGKLKTRRLARSLVSVPGLMVGSCVPFYFCPRSPMLYIYKQKNHPELTYFGGQEPIVHLESDLLQALGYAHAHNQRWSFTLSNASSSYFEDRCDINCLGELNWNVIGSKYWSGAQDAKMAEFLMEHSFHWHLVSRIGVFGPSLTNAVSQAMGSNAHRPPIEIHREWYY